jgi:hypothetical protein
MEFAFAIDGLCTNTSFWFNWIGRCGETGLWPVKVTFHEMAAAPVIAHTVCPIVCDSCSSQTSFSSNSLALSLPAGPKHVVK